MSVDVAVGTGKIDTGSGYAYNAWSDAINNVAITTADATNPRRDIIVAYIDKSVVSSASNDNPGALKFIAVAGTPAGSPSDPSGSTIQSAVGAANPYTQLARVSVAASASSITNAVIGDLRSTVTVNANIGGSDGWNSLGYTPSTVTANGNRSYSLTFSGVDLTPTLSPGMRFRTTRTVSAPRQSTSLNGTTQYYSKTSPAGMTFTGDHSYMSWVKLSSYAAASIISRDSNSVTGWSFDLTASGQIEAVFRDGANTTFADSYQSIPLNKWVHLAVSVAASTKTFTMYIDGVSVPVGTASGTATTVSQGSQPLMIGAKNSGTIKFFPGKIAQAAVFSAAINAATIQSYMSQGLAGTETSLISAYSFNNSINDLNANANNLTANGSAVATNADSPFGGQAGGTISSTLDYGIITKTAFSTNTTLTVQLPEGCTIPTSEGVSAVSYSTQKVPYLFPGQEGKWYIETIIGADTTSFGAKTAATWFDTLFAITAPIGEWTTDARVGSQANGTSVVRTPMVALSTSTSSLSDRALVGICGKSLATDVGGHGIIREPVSLAAQTVYHLLATDGSNNTTNFYILGSVNANAQSSIKFRCAYL